MLAHSNTGPRPFNHALTPSWRRAYNLVKSEFQGLVGAVCLRFGCDLVMKGRPLVRD